MDFEKVDKSEELRKRILASARTLFLQKGIENVNMHQIAKMAKIGQASLYRRYSDIGQICMEIVSEECQPFLDELQLDLQSSIDSPLEQLYHVIVKFIDFLDLNTPWLSDVNRASTGYRPLQSPLFQEMRKILSHLYHEALHKGEIVEVDVSYTVQAFLSTLQDFDAHKNDNEFDANRILRGLHRIYIEGLKNTTQNRG